MLRHSNSSKLLCYNFTIVRYLGTCIVWKFNIAYDIRFFAPYVSKMKAINISVWNLLRFLYTTYCWNVLEVLHIRLNVFPVKAKYSGRGKQLYSYEFEISVSRDCSETSRKQLSSKIDDELFQISKFNLREIFKWKY